jgi:hypothetical protein
MSEAICLNLDLMPNSFAVCRLGPEERIPTWASLGDFFSITKNAEELSIVCEEDMTPGSVRAERGWRALRVQGTLDFGLIGILAALATPLAEAGVSIFAISTFNTDYVLVMGRDLDRAISALTAVGHKVSRNIVD